MVRIADAREGTRSRGRLEIIDGHKESVAAWMLERLPHVIEGPILYEAIGVARNGAIVGGCWYANYHLMAGGGSIEMAAVGHNWMSRRIIAELLGYPFRQLGCHRVTAITPKSNKPSRRFLEKLGFRLEGIARQGFGPRSHACIYGMLRDECRWLKV